MKCEVWLSSGAGYFVEFQGAETFQDYLERLEGNKWIILEEEGVAINTDQITEVKMMEAQEGGTGR